MCEWLQEYRTSLEESKNLNTSEIAHQRIVPTKYNEEMSTELIPHNLTKLKDDPNKQLIEKSQIDKTERIVLHPNDSYYEVISSTE